MEHFCGAIGQHVKNRRNPYRSLDWRAQDIAQLQLVKLKYGLIDELSLKRSNVNVKGGGMMFEDGPCKCFAILSLEHVPEGNVTDTEYVILPPKKKLKIDNWLHRKLAAMLVTRYSPDDPQMKISMATASKHIPARVCQWGQVQICNGGNRFKGCALVKGQRYARNCSYVKVSTS